LKGAVVARFGYRTNKKWLPNQEIAVSMVLIISHLGGSNFLRWKKSGTTVVEVKSYGGGSRLLRWWEIASTVVVV